MTNGNIPTTTLLGFKISGLGALRVRGRFQDINVSDDDQTRTPTNVAWLERMGLKVYGFGVGFTGVGV